VSSKNANMPHKKSFSYTLNLDIPHKISCRLEFAEKVETTYEKKVGTLQFFERMFRST
jgi:hypothetical protein